MVKWIKKHFIPHEGNEHRPHILRKESIRYIILVIIFFEIAAYLLPVLSKVNNTDGMAAVLPAVLTTLTNDERQSVDLNTLVENPILDKAAEMKANDMATKNYFAHTSPEGITPWYWLEKVGYKYQYAGENLAVDFIDSADVTKAWMASPTHKANIVKKNYTEVGTGVAVGMYEGKETTFVAQLYANPLPKSVEPTKPKKIAVENTSISPQNVLGAESSDSGVNVSDVKYLETKELVKTPTFIQKLLASPRSTMNIVLYSFFGLILASLFLYVFIKMTNHHKDLINNALVVIAIIGVFFVTNYLLSFKNMVVAKSLDYSYVNK